MSDFAYPLHEECGVFGIYDRAGTEDVAAAAYSALYALQHRGQESCGIAVNDDGVINGHRDLGLVNEVFTPAVLGSLAKPTAHMATGHVRYATSGSRIRANAQPMIVRHGRGTMALCHNGNLTNALELRRQLENEGAIFHGSSDTEVICYLVTRNRLRMGSIEIAISKTMDVLEGAYSLVVMSATKLIAVRDPRGYRPLCIGTLPGGGYVFASESCALDAVGATLLRDVEPGEIVITDTKTGELRSIKDHCGRPDRQMCVFEFIYFARPDSIIEGSSVHEARKQAGRFLAQEHPVEADVVIGVPDSGLDAALGYSQESGIPYGIGFIKNKYIGRTFIQGSQKQRENSVTPSCAAPPLPASSSCCGTPEQRKSTSAFRHPPSNIPATSAPTSPTRSFWSLPAARWTRSTRSLAPTRWATSPRSTSSSWPRTPTAASAPPASPANTP